MSKVISLRRIFSLRTVSLCLLFPLVVLMVPERIHAQIERSPEIQAAIDRGVTYLRSRPRSASMGRIMLVALALIKSGVEESDPALQSRIQHAHASVSGSDFAPGIQHDGLYAAGIVAMILGALDRSLYRDGIEKVARYIMAHQNPNGSWNYPASGQTGGDTSVTQYAMLGLWEASMAGIDIPPRVFDQAASWHLEAQDKDTGGYGYRPLVRGVQKKPRHTMTAGALGSLLICLRRGPTSKPILKHPLLVPILDEEGKPKQYVPTVSTSAIRSAVARAHNWLGNDLAITDPTGLGRYYYFYGVERYGALAEIEEIGSVNWYTAIAENILDRQLPDGSWNDAHGKMIDTSFALLFLARATEQVVEQEELFERLLGGILVGGRGLPRDFTEVAVQNEGFVVKPLQGSLDQLLGMIRTQSGSTLKGAVAGLDLALRQSDPATLRLGISRLEELADDPRALTRQIAVWALARQERLEVVPTLIQTLDDRAETVREEALAGLRVLSRRFSEGGESSSSENRDWTTADEWKVWYRALDPKWHWKEP